MTSGPTTDEATADAAVRWRRADAALWRLVPGSLVALGPEDEGPLLLTGPAVEAWVVLEQPHTAEGLTTLLADRYGVEPDQIADDVTRLLDDLDEHGLVTVEDSTTSAADSAASLNDAAAPADPEPAVPEPTDVDR